MNTITKTKAITALVATCLIGIGTGVSLAAGDVETPKEIRVETLASVETTAGSAASQTKFNPFNGTSIAGHYLSGRFAQQHHDWASANVFMSRVLKIDPNDADLMKKSMVLAMGSGDADNAVAMAANVLKEEPDSSLALLFLATDAFKRKDYDGAAKFIAQVPESGLSDFIMPLLKSWSEAANGKFETANLQDNSIHIYHAILIADYLGKKDMIAPLLQEALKIENLSARSVERIADVFVHIGKDKAAIDLYQRVLQTVPDYTGVTDKIKTLESGKKTDAFKTVNTPEKGVSLALLDTAQTLFHEYSDDSARVFGHMSLFTEADQDEAKMLLAHIASRHERYGQAIEHYKSISPTNENYLDARRRAASLLEETKRKEEALVELQSLVDNHNDLESLIQIGDLYRHDEDFGKALEYYNKSAKKFGKTIPADYWHLHYVRGMSYERLGKWKQAEADLKAALSFQPNHPFVLNYLGYAWADQGTNLEESLSMIRKASALRPSDGYITDSLGWVLYRMGHYEEAVPHLEKAVELLPYDPVVNDHLGDAYWRVTRKLEAKFQWNRARNYAEDGDEKLVTQIAQKLARGLTDPPVVRASNTIEGDKGVLSP